MSSLSPYYYNALALHLRSEGAGGTVLLRTFAVAIVQGGLHRAVTHATVHVCRSPCSSTDRIEVS